MPVIAGEELVAAVSGQRDGHLLTGDLADQVGRDLGDVSERFVPDVRQPADHVDGLGVADLHRGVIGPEVPRPRRQPRRASSKDRSANPMVKVRTGPVACRCIRATMALESIPPDKKAPTGTSATIRAATESDNVESSWSVNSASVPDSGRWRARSTASAADQ